MVVEKVAQGGLEEGSGVMERTVALESCDHTSHSWRAATTVPPLVSA